MSASSVHLKTCPICLEAYDDDTFVPTVLKCGHSLCIACANACKNTTTNQITCSICRQQITVKRAWVKCPDLVNVVTSTSSAVSDDRVEVVKTSSPASSIDVTAPRKKHSSSSKGTKTHRIKQFPSPHCVKTPMRHTYTLNGKCYWSPSGWYCRSTNRIYDPRGLRWSIAFAVNDVTRESYVSVRRMFECDHRTYFTIVVTHINGRPLTYFEALPLREHRYNNVMIYSDPFKMMFDSSFFANGCYSITARIDVTCDQ